MFERALCRARLGSSVLVAGLAVSLLATLSVGADVRAQQPQRGAPTGAAAESSAAAEPITAKVDDEHHRIARRLIDKAIAYLRAQQDTATGGWSVNPEGSPQIPAITALVLAGMMMEPSAGDDDEAIRRGIDFILKYRQDDGGIYDTILPNYNTAISLSVLARSQRSDALAAIKPAQDFLRGLQWDGQADPHGNVVDRNHPFYGGAGYGNHGRPDNSNLILMLQGMYDSGVDCNDVAFQRAIVFLQRTQMLDEVNDMPYADGSSQGGFIYATGPNKDAIGEGESKAGMIEETLSDGTTGSRLRAYGSMTYAGFKSYIYAQLDRDDVRVRAAHEWLRRNYTLKQNPGIGMDGFYYYLVTFSRALDAWGEPTVSTLRPDGTPGETRRWAHDLIDELAARQREDGSWINSDDSRWMEDNPVLVTAYALIALQHAID